MRRTTRDARGRRMRGMRTKTKRKRPLILYERDLYALSQLLEAPYLRTQHIHGAIPAELRGGYSAYRDRWGAVIFNQGGYVAYPLQQDIPYSGYMNQPAIWRLTQKGKDALRDAGMYQDDIARFYTSANPVTNRQLPHSMGTWDNYQSLKIGVLDDPLARWRNWMEIINGEKVSEETKKKEIPYQLRVTIQGTFANGKASEPYTFNLTADAPPCGAEYHLGEQRRYRNFFFEYESGENRIEPSDFSDSSFFKKYLGWNAAGQRKRRKDGTFEPSLVEEQLGLSSFLVPVPCPSELHIRNMIRCIMRASNGRGSTRFLFYRVPEWGEKIEPLTDMWTSPWQRAGHAPFRLSNPEAHEVCEGCDEDRPEGECRLIETKGGRRPEHKWLCASCQITKKAA